MTPRIVLPLFVGIAAASLLAAGCGGDSPSGTSTPVSTGQRQAAAAQVTPDSKTCPPRLPYFTWDGKITNRLDVPVRLTVGDYTCDDWSGSSTPGAAMNGKVIAPRGELKVHLTPREYRTRQWTMSFAIDNGPDLGSARMWIRQSAGDNDWSTPGQGAYQRTWDFAGDSQCAWFLPLQMTGASDTPTSLLPNYPQWMGIVVSRRHIAVVTQAGGGSCESE